MFGRSARLFVVAAAGMVVLFSVAAATAFGSFSGASVSGEITRAEANATWASASIAGSAQWSECPEEPMVEPFLEGGIIIWDPPLGCSWTPYATIAHGSNPAECNAPDRQLNLLGDSVFLAWQGAIRTAADSQSFDIPDSPMDGTAGQLLCLSMWETAYEPVFCAENSESLAPHSQGATPAVIGGECPEFLPVSSYYTLDAMTLQSAQPSGDTGTGASKSQTPNVAAGAGPQSVAVPWGVSSILGRRSLMLSWTANYCVGKGSPQPERLAVNWLPRRHGRFRARITVYVSYPPDGGQLAGSPGCDLARVSMSQRVRLRHPLLRSVLLDGAASPMRQRWPG